MDFSLPRRIHVTFDCQVSTCHHDFHNQSLHCDFFRGRDQRIHRGEPRATQTVNPQRTWGGLMFQGQLTWKRPLLQHEQWNPWEPLGNPWFSVARFLRGGTVFAKSCPNGPSGDLPKMLVGERNPIRFHPQMHIWMIMNDYEWLWMIMNDYEWLWMIMNDYEWLWMHVDQQVSMMENNSAPSLTKLVPCISRNPSFHRDALGIGARAP